MLVGTFGVPWITFVLARSITRSQAVALAAGITVLLYGPMFMWSLYSMADLTYGFFVLLSLYFAVRGFENPRWFIAMGVALALSYLAKSLGLIPVAGIVAYYAVTRIFQRPLLPFSRKDLFFALGMASMLLVLLPWFIRNTYYFGDPLYNNHKHVMGYLGWEPWEESTYAVYWDRELPTWMRKLREDPQRLMTDSLWHLYNHYRSLFIRVHPHLSLREENTITVNSQENIPPFSLRDISTYWTGVPALAGIACFLLLKLFRKNADAFKGFGLFLFTGGFQVLSLSMLWLPVNRLNTPLIPLVAIMGYATIHLFLKKASHRIARKTGMITVLLCSLWSGFELSDLAYARASQGFPWKEAGENVMSMADWIRENIPDAKVMARNAWALHFYSGVQTVRLPSGSMRDLIRVARHYGVTHICPDNNHPEFARWSRSGLSGLRPVHTTMGSVLFEIDYALIPAEYGKP
ncbi:MAG: phospholipid carrier-dependent glycosyltransferase, partial [Planctomycetota bacterium]